MTQKQNMAMVLQALKKQGLSDNQARILAAEVGRESGFLSKNLFGYHTDAANAARNVGMISWQGSRGEALEKRLRDAGLLKNGAITQSQDSLDVMAGFLVDEIKNNPKYAETKRLFLDNPDVDYQTGNRVLGRNFIRWRYDDRKYASGHRNRDNFYQQLGGAMAMALAEPQANSTPVMPNIQADSINIEPIAKQANANLSDFRQLESLSDSIPKQVQRAYLNDLKIKQLDFNDYLEHESKIAQAFGEYPDMSAAIPDYIDSLIQSIYDEA